MANATIYPNPDPMLRYIPEEEAPAGFWQLGQQERSKRARFHIICRCSGMDALNAWILTMDVSPAGQALVEEFVANSANKAAEDGVEPDTRIMEMLRVDGGWVNESA